MWYNLRMELVSHTGGVFLIAMKKENFVLHICCAPCATHVIDLLEEEYALSALFFNPNIHPPCEYGLRREEAARYCGARDLPFIMSCCKPADWFDAVRGYESDREGGRRCDICIRMRLEESARVARRRGAAIFGTTLSISPHKNASRINQIGNEIARARGLRFHEADFKKRDGYRKSCVLSREAGLYRQNYCGCIFSYMEGKRN